MKTIDELRAWWHKQRNLNRVANHADSISLKELVPELFDILEDQQRRINAVEELILARTFNAQRADVNLGKLGGVASDDGAPKIDRSAQRTDGSD